MVWRDMSWLPDNLTTFKKLIQEPVEANSVFDQEVIIDQYKQHYKISAPHLYEDDEIS